MLEFLEEEYFNPDFLEVDRVIDINEQIDPATGKKIRHLLVKWRALPYEDCTWELEDDVDPIKIKHFEAYRYPPSKDQWKNKKRPKSSEWKKKEESPLYRNNNTLREYQLEGLNWLTFSWYNHRNCILADEMGLGKTIQSLAFVQAVYEYGIKGPNLIIAPLSTIPNWQREFELWTELNVIVYHGTNASRNMVQEYEMYYKDEKGNRIKDIYKFNVLITTYEIIIMDCFDLRDIPWKLCVIDEAHRLKNKNCKLVEGLRLLSMEHCVLLSGTPLQNNIGELFSLLNFLEPSQFSSLEAFALEFGNLQSEDQVQKLQTLLKPMMLRRLKEDVEKSIAPKEETIIEVELTNMQKKYYRAILEKNFSFLSKGTTSANVPNLMNTMMELRKCCIHPYLLNGAEDQIQNDYRLQYGEDQDLYHKALIHSSGKMVLIDKLLPKLKANGHRVLLFSQMVRLLDILEDYLIFRKYPYERIDGRIRGNLRQAAIDRYCKPDSDRFVFLLCTKAGGLGINLTAADTVIIYDSDWNPQNDLQAQARCHRIGQAKMVKVYRLICRNTYEREMFDKASLKLGLDKAVLQSMNTSQGKIGDFSSNKQLSKKEIEDLLKKGAYGAIMDDDNAGDQFCEEDIDQILMRRTQVITHEEEKGSTFSKASFMADGIRTDIDLNDPDFWKKWAKKAEVDTDEMKSKNELMISEPRRRNKIKRYGHDEAVLDMSELESSSNSDEEVLAGRGGRGGRGGKGRQSRRLRSMRNYDEDFMATDADVEYGSWSKNECFKVEKGLLTFGWGRWMETLAHGQFHRSWNEENVKDCARVILLYCLNHYKGDDKIKGFIWDLITPSDAVGMESRMRNHMGLSAPVPRGRKGKKKQKEAKMISEHIEECNWMRDEKYNPENYLDNGYKKHLNRHANKVLLRVRMLYYIKHEVVGEYVHKVSQGMHSSDLPIYPPPCDQPPVPWWDFEADKSLLVGTYKHGYERYNVMRLDPTLSFLARCGPPDGADLLAEINDNEAHEDDLDKAPDEEDTDDMEISMPTVSSSVAAKEMPPPVDSGEMGKMSWPSQSDLNTRLRRIITSYQRNYKREELKLAQRARRMERREKIEQIVRERERQKMEVQQRRWSRREEADFYRTVSTFGVEYNRKEKCYDWNRFRIISRLDRKFDDTLTEYFRAFYAMCKRVCGKKLTEEEEFEMLQVVVEPISEERARRTLERIDLLNKLREEILCHPLLDERLKLCQPAMDMPDWWVPGKHDKDLIIGAAKHGLGRTDFYILNDQELSFKEILRRHMAGEPLVDPEKVDAKENKLEIKVEKKLEIKEEPKDVKIEGDRTVKEELNDSNDEVIKDKDENMEMTVKQEITKEVDCDKTEMKEECKTEMKEEPGSDGYDPETSDGPASVPEEKSDKKEDIQVEEEREEKTPECEEVNKVEEEESKEESKEEEDKTTEAIDSEVTAETKEEIEEPTELQEEKSCADDNTYESDKDNTEKPVDAKEENVKEEINVKREEEETPEERKEKVVEMEKEAEVEIKKEVEVKKEKVKCEPFEILSETKGEVTITKLPMKEESHEDLKLKLKIQGGKVVTEEVRPALEHKLHLNPLDMPQPLLSLAQMDEAIARQGYLTNYGEPSDYLGEPTVAQLLAQSYQNPIRWPKDKILQIRLEHIVHAIEKNEWPVPHYFTAFPLGGSFDLDSTPQETPDATPMRDTSTPVSEGSDVLLGDEGSSSLPLGTKRRRRLDLDSERAKLRALMNHNLHQTAALSKHLTIRGEGSTEDTQSEDSSWDVQALMELLGTLRPWRKTDTSTNSSKAAESTPVSVSLPPPAVHQPPPAHQHSSPRSGSAPLGSIDLSFRSGSVSITPVSAAPTASVPPPCPVTPPMTVTATLVPMDLSSGLPVKPGSSENAASGEAPGDGAVLDLQMKSNKASKLEITLDKIRKRKSWEETEGKEKKRKKLDDIVLGLSAAKNQPSILSTPPKDEINVGRATISILPRPSSKDCAPTFPTFTPVSTMSSFLGTPSISILANPKERSSSVTISPGQSLLKRPEQRSSELHKSDLTKLAELASPKFDLYGSQDAKVNKWLADHVGFPAERPGTPDFLDGRRRRRPRVDPAMLDWNKLTGEENVSVINRLTGKKITGSKAPQLRSLAQWLLENPMFDVDPKWADLVKQKGNLPGDLKQRISNEKKKGPGRPPLLSSPPVSAVTTLANIASIANSLSTSLPSGIGPSYTSSGLSNLSGLNPNLLANLPIGALDPKNPLFNIMPFGGIPNLSNLNNLNNLGITSPLFSNLAGFGLPSMPMDNLPLSSTNKKDSTSHREEKARKQHSVTSSLPTMGSSSLPFLFPNPSLMYNPLGLSSLNPFAIPPSMSSAFANLAQSGLMNGITTGLTTASSTTSSTTTTAPSSIQKVSTTPTVTSTPTTTTHIPTTAAGTTSHHQGESDDESLKSLMGNHEDDDLPEEDNNMENAERVVLKESKDFEKELEQHRLDWQREKERNVVKERMEPRRGLTAEERFLLREKKKERLAKEMWLEQREKQRDQSEQELKNLLQQVASENRDGSVASTSGIGLTNKGQSVDISKVVPASVKVKTKEVKLSKKLNLESKLSKLAASVSKNKEQDNVEEKDHVNENDSRDSEKKVEKDTVKLNDTVIHEQTFESSEEKAETEEL